jgi:two-component system, OmpR family, sensor histidine kinase MprB
MSLRVRLALAMAASVVVAVVVVSAALAAELRYQLNHQVDDALRASARQLAPLGPAAATSAGGVGRPRYVRVLDASGDQVPSAQPAAPLPVTADARRIARGGAGTDPETVQAGGASVRVLTVPLAGGGALQLGEPTDILYGVFRAVLGTTALIALGAAAVSGGVGLLLGRTVLRPVRRLTAVAEHVSRTGDPAARITTAERDELGRLARSFNAMLAALESALAAQRRLVSDASHELRTPLTSLRTNIEVLAAPDGLPPGERGRLTRDLVLQCDELADLVSNLVELASADEPGGTNELLRLDRLVAQVVERAQRHRPLVRYELTLSPEVIRGRSDRVARAVANLVDNAAKWTPAGGLVEVGVAGGRVTVRDRGPGIDAADAPYVFDRFYRAPAARSMPGSGLGLAIARQVAEAHGGGASYRPAPGGARCSRSTSRSPLSPA